MTELDFPHHLPYLLEIVNFWHRTCTGASSSTRSFERVIRKPGSANGPSALNDPENVEKIVVVSFGAFDRYYICWKDKVGQYVQGKGLTFSFALKKLRSSTPYSKK
jgi:hypothetical protein